MPFGASARAAVHASECRADVWGRETSVHGRSCPAGAGASLASGRRPPRAAFWRFRTRGGERPMVLGGRLEAWDIPRWSRICCRCGGAARRRAGLPETCGCSSRRKAPPCPSPRFDRFHRRWRVFARAGPFVRCPPRGGDARYLGGAPVHVRAFIARAIGQAKFFILQDARKILAMLLETWQSDA